MSTTNIATTKATATPTSTVVDIDPRQVQIGANVRLDPNVDKDFVTNVRDRGVIVPVVGYFDDGGQYVVVDGQRRTLAAIEVGQPTIPAFATHHRQDADRIIDQMSANYHRADITAIERAKGFEQLAGFGLSAAQIAKKTGYKRPEVNAGLKVAGSDLASKATERWDFLTLEQAAGLAEFEQDADAITALTVAAQRGGFEHELQRQRDRREEREAIDALAQQLTAGGVRVVERPAWDDKTAKELDRLVDDDGNQITPKAHAGCPGHAAFVVHQWEYAQSDEEGEDDETDEPGEEAGQYVTSAAYVCTDYQGHKHLDRRAQFSRTTGKPKAAEMSNQEREAARQGRREVIESNKAWKSAETVRASWVTKFLTRKIAPKGSAAFVAATIADYSGALSDYRAPGKVDELLHGGKHRTRDERAKAMENVTDGRALMIAVGHCCAAYESQMGTHTWRSVQAGPARYLAFLAANGYEEADVEKRAAGLDTPARKARARKARTSAATAPDQAQDRADEPSDEADQVTEDN